MARPQRQAAALSATRRAPPVPDATRTSGRRGSMASAGAPEALRVCARSRRAIGHDFSQTETIRDMIPLQLPLTGAAVAAALERRLPSPGGEGVEAVATSRRGGDAPARRC